VLHELWEDLLFLEKIVPALDVILWVFYITSLHCSIVAKKGCYLLIKVTYLHYTLLFFTAREDIVYWDFKVWEMRNSGLDCLMGRELFPFPGIRFHPTDVELVMYFLMRKVMGRKFRVEVIAEVDVYKFAPWDLPGTWENSYIHPSVFNKLHSFVLLISILCFLCLFLLKCVCSFTR
jgi:hypothetical protein